MRRISSVGFDRDFQRWSDDVYNVFAPHFVHIEFTSLHPPEATPHRVHKVRH